MFPMELFSTGLSTTERIAVGVLSLIALIVYLRWRGPVATIARQKITAARHPVVETAGGPSRCADHGGARRA